MLSDAGSRLRVSRLRERLAPPWDAALISRPEHLLYFANFFPHPCSLNLQSTSMLLIERDGPATLFTDNWLARDQRAAVDDVRVVEWYASQRPALNRAAAVCVAVSGDLASRNVRRVACERSHLPEAVGRDLDVTWDIEPTIRAMREIKDEDEVEAIRRAIVAAEAAHAASRELLRENLREIDYYAQLVERATVAAATPFVMMCDLVSGDRAARGSGGPTTRVMARGELVILDFFPYVDGYRGDIANTLVVSGRPSAEQQDLFGVVVEGLRQGERLLKPGTAVADIHAAIDAVLRTALPTGLRHHAGHGIGLGHPESPELVPESDRTIEIGMVVTLEPGVYGETFGGIRVEHNYLITADGFERLSNHRLGLF